MSRSTNPTAYAALVSDTFLFAGIPEADIRVLLDEDEILVKHYHKDEVVLDRSAKARVLGIILYGRCMVIKESDTGKMPMSVLRRKQLFGAAALFHHEPDYVARVTAAESTWVLLIPEETLKRMMKNNFGIVENYLDYLTARIRFLSARLDGFLPQTVEERVFRHISQHAENGVYRPEWSVSALAEAFRISRTTLYRAIDKLVSEGKIERCGRAFRLSKGENE